MKRYKFNYSILSLIAAFMLTFSLANNVDAASFKDVPKSHANYEAIMSLAEAGVINGYGDDSFRPGVKLSRENVVVILGRYMEKEGYKIPSDYKKRARFKDVPLSSKEALLKYSALVYDYGVFRGSNGNLLPNDLMRRDNMAQVLVRSFSSFKGVDLLAYVKERKYTAHYTDLKNVSEDAKAALAVLSYFDVEDSKTYRPRVNASRGDFAQYFYSLSRNIDSIIKDDQRADIVSYENYANKYVLKFNRVIEEAALEDIKVTQYVDGVASVVKPTSLYVSKTEFLDIHMPAVSPRTIAQKVYYDIQFKDGNVLRTKETTLAAVTPTATVTNVKGGIVTVEFNVPISNTVGFSDIWVSGGTLHLLGQSKDGKTLEIGINNLVPYYAYYLKIGNLVIDGKTMTLETKTFVPSSY